MATPTPTPLIGVYGPEESATSEPRGCALWATGYAAAITTAGGSPVTLGDTTAGLSWDVILHDVKGLVLTGSFRSCTHPLADETRLIEWCRKHKLPLLAVDHGLHMLNCTYGGTLYAELSRELPEALQHRHPPERGLRHAIEIPAGNRLTAVYGEGELVVNSEHRGAVNKLAKGFRVSARALDGVIEAVEAEAPDWFAIGVQWRPAAVSASGLDIQLFRALVDAGLARTATPTRSARPALAAAA